MALARGSEFPRQAIATLDTGGAWQAADVKNGRPSHEAVRVGTVELLDADGQHRQESQCVAKACVVRRPTALRDVDHAERN